MAQSSEYPDLKWMPPRSWTRANRTSVQVVVIHDTEGSEGPTSAEDGAAYDQRRTDGTSTHYFHDSDSTVQCVLTTNQAHAARMQGNRRGIQHELCGRAGQGAAGWADAVSQGTLWRAAKQVARDCKKWDIPARKLTASQVAAGTKGICGHAEITAAFPQDGGTHTDPGPTFPWSQFLDMVQAEMEDDMATLTAAEVQAAIASLYATAANATDADATNDTQLGRNFRSNLDKINDFAEKAGPLTDAMKDVAAQLADLKTQLADLAAKVDDLAP